MDIEGSPFQIDRHVIGSIFHDDKEGKDYIAFTSMNTFQLLRESVCPKTCRHIARRLMNG